MTMGLTPHFSMDELTLSQTAIRKGLNNEPSFTAAHYLIELCQVILEPAWALFGDAHPIMVSSGYRSPEVNHDVGGVPSSAHVEGRAADITVKGFGLVEVFDALAASQLPFLPFDQLIYELGGWIHVSIPRDGQDPRRQLLMKLPGRTGYEPFDHSAITH